MSIPDLARNAKYLKTLTIAVFVKNLGKFCNLALFGKRLSDAQNLRFSSNTFQH